jgi:hypothetical protein
MCWRSKFVLSPYRVLPRHGASECYTSECYNGAVVSEYFGGLLVEGLLLVELKTVKLHPRRGSGDNVSIAVERPACSLVRLIISASHIGRSNA